MLSYITDRKILAKIARDCNKLVMMNLDLSDEVELPNTDPVTGKDLEEVMAFAFEEQDPMKTFFSIQLSDGYYLDIRTPVTVEFGEEFDLLIYKKADYLCNGCIYSGVKNAIKHIAFKKDEIEKFTMKFGSILEKIAVNKVKLVKMCIEL